MYTLYIDTHMENIVLALFKDEELVSKRSVVSREHSKNTVLLLDNLLKDNKIEVGDLGEVVVITGPGSFTGVRIGIVIAKMLGYTLNIPIKGLSYLEALSIKYNNNVTLGIKDKNGVFIGEFDDKHNLINDYYYLSNGEFEKSSDKVITYDEVDVELVIKYVVDKPTISPHLLVPLYVKKLNV